MRASATRWSWRSRRRAAAAARTPATVEIVVTPGSGEGGAMGAARRLSRLLARRGYQPNVRSFADLPELERWAAELEPGPSHIVCIGGDGTLSAAAPAAIRTGIPFVPVASGFGNVFARVFRLPGRVEEAATLLESGTMRRVDVGVVVAGRRVQEVFLSHRSFGILEQIQAAAEHQRQQPRRRLLRYLWYHKVAFELASRQRLSGCAVEVDGRRVADDAVLVTVANVETYHGILPLTPTASPIDGLFDIAVFPRMSKAALARQLVWLLLRLPGRWRRIHLHRGRHVVVTTPRRHEELRVSRRALPLVVPAGAIAELQRRTAEEATALEEAGRALEKPRQRSV